MTRLFLGNFSPLEYFLFEWYTIERVRFLVARLKDRGDCGGTLSASKCVASSAASISSSSLDESECSS